MKRLRDIMPNGLSGALVLSLLAHGLIAAVLLITLPLPEPDPEPAEQVVEVTLVEPQKVPQPEIEEPAPMEPEPPAAADPAPQSAEPEASLPEPEPEPDTEQAASEPAQAAAASEAEDQGQAVPIPVLRPVFQFGARDAGPRVALDGASAEEPARSEASETETAPPPLPQTAEPGQDEPTTASQDPPEPEPQEQAIAGLSLPELTLPGSGLPQGALPEPEPEAEPPAPAPAQIPGPPEPETSTPEADPLVEETATDAAAVDLTEAGRLFSPVLTEDRAAMVAMGSLPRELRASQLCTTELREQLRNAAPPFHPELLPSYRLDSGNVLAVPDAAFRASGAWYDLSFRCTVDADALQVAGFALKIGQAIPQAEWKARGFPNF